MGEQSKWERSRTYGYLWRIQIWIITVLLALYSFSRCMLQSMRKLVGMDTTCFSCSQYELFSAEAGECNT